MGLVVDQLAAAKHAGKASGGMRWLVMDMTQLEFEDAQFDVVLDKCAMDALLVDEGPSAIS